MDAAQIEKYRIKRLFKLKGRLKSIEKKGANGDWHQIVIYKGQGEKRKLYVFETNDRAIISVIKSLPIKAIVRTYFEIKTTEWNGKLYTGLIARMCEVCAVNEEKIKKLARQTEMFNELEYKSSLKNKFGNIDDS